MANSLLRRPAVRVSLVILLLFILFAVVWNVLHSGLPSPGSDRYRQMVSQFYAGVMGLEVGDAETTPVEVAPAGAEDSTAEKK